MARLAGKNGSIELGGGAVLGVTSWTLEIEADTLDATGMDSNGNAQFVAGIARWRGTAEGFWDTTEAKFVGAPPTLAIGVSVTVTCKLSATVGNRYTGTGIINSFRPSGEVAGLMQFSIGFQGTGALTYPTV
ncbi:MAG: hypothetical protein FJW69_09660 [Actinobacteria bacterium]|nr:hypothetical protein [Actinomycetota bacterium]